MANFEGHIVWGLGSGVALAATGLKLNYIRPMEAGIGVILVLVGTSIPDIDYGKDPITKEEKESKPFLFFTFLLSLGLSVLFYLYYFDSITASFEFDSVQGIFLFYLILALFVLSIRFFMRNITTHRGVIHSIPFAILCAELAYMTFASKDVLALLPSANKLAGYFTAAVFLGYLTHLLVDELYSIKWIESFKARRFRKKKSFGSALTPYSKKSRVLYFVLYLLVIALFFAIMNGVTLQPLFTMIIRSLTQ
jgi:hypothetical protein